jgi:aminoglycoside 3-N-acetyltransferase
MQTVTSNQVSFILEVLGVRPGDGLLVHSALQFLGKPEGGVRMYYQAIEAAIGAECGTIAVPAFNFAFAHGEPYDPLNTPAQGMGSLSEFVRKLPGVQRTSHPMQSLAVIGCHALDLARRDTLSAFDPGSAFERLLELNFKLLLLGADIQAVSMVHYCEQRAGVPYRYWKEFTGPVQVYSEGGRYHSETRTYRMYVRDLEVESKLDLSPVQKLLEERGQWAAQRLNYGWVSCCNLVDFVQAGDTLLVVDPWALVAGKKD